MEVRIAAVCCAVVCMATICTSNGPVLPCPCPRVSDTKVPVENLWKYTMQKKNLCVIDAIRFETVMGKILCSDPRSPWAQKAKNYLDKKPVIPKPHTRRETNTVLPKHKRIWLKSRKNRWKKPGLRKKQTTNLINHLRPNASRVSMPTINSAQKTA